MIHFTRERECISRNKKYKLSALENLIDIISSGFIEGSNERGFIAGNYRCICLTEAPLNAIPNGLSKNDNSGLYSGFGIKLSKKHVFSKGGRPVIYQKKSELELLPEELKWRHCTYDLEESTYTDFTWEREWRIKTDKLKITPQTATLVLPGNQVEAFKEYWEIMQIADSIDVCKDPESGTFQAISSFNPEEFPWDVETADGDKIPL